MLHQSAKSFYVHETYLEVVTLVLKVSIKPYNTSKSNSGSSTDQNLKAKSATRVESSIEYLHKEIGRNIERYTNPELHSGKYLGNRLKTIQ